MVSKFVKGVVVTLFTLDIKKTNLKTSFIYLGVSAFVLIFSLVYSLFSHEVYSDYLSYAFLYPLIGGALLYFGLHFTKHFAKWPYNFYNAGIATVTVGSILCGVNEVAGADTLYYLWFYLVGWFFIFLSIFVLLLGLTKALVLYLKRRNNK